METVIEAGHTHFYPGHEGWIAGDAPAREGKATAVRIAFGDGVMAAGTLGPAGDSWELDVAPYTTAAGTAIPAKRWRVALRPEADGRTRFRIERKLPARNG